MVAEGGKGELGREEKFGTDTGAGAKMRRASK
jgi:hypothetical protein